MKKTKQQMFDEAWKELNEKINPYLKKYIKIKKLFEKVYEEYRKKTELSWNEYTKKMKEIEEHPTQEDIVGNKAFELGQI